MISYDNKEAQKALILKNQGFKLTEPIETLPQIYDFDKDD